MKKPEEELEYYDIDPDEGYEEEMRALDDAEEAREWEDWTIENEFMKGTNEYIDPWNVV